MDRQIINMFGNINLSTRIVHCLAERPSSAAEPQPEKASIGVSPYRCAGVNTTARH
jgi:hypothetical protein